MGQQTNIAWTDSTVNFCSGCTKVSAGCQHCYAEELSSRFGTDHGKLAGKEPTGSLGAWGKGAPRRLHESAFKLAHRLNRKPWVCGCGNSLSHAQASSVGMQCARDVHGGVPVPFHRRRIFSLSLGDWLDPEIPVEWLARMLDTIRQCDQVVWQLVTKRPELWSDRTMSVLTHWAKVGGGDSASWLLKWRMDDIAPPNIWILTSVENQETADERIPHLLKIPAVVHGLSVEPMLGPVDLERVQWKTMDDHHGHPQPDHSENVLIGGGPARIPKVAWIIIGGESGPDARPCNVEWIRSLVQQGHAADCAVFVKQLGSNPCSSELTSDEFAPYMGKLKLKHPKGGDPAEWPEDLRVQQFPNT